MAHFAQRWGVRCLLVLSILLVTGAAQRAAADEIETRLFTVQVDGKPAGQYTMMITRRDGGVESMSAQANVRVKHLFGTYVYTYQGTESWTNGRLQQLQSNTSDDGKRFEVQVTAE